MMIGMMPTVAFAESGSTVMSAETVDFTRPDNMSDEDYDVKFEEAKNILTNNGATVTVTKTGSGYDMKFALLILILLLLHRLL